MRINWNKLYDVAVYSVILMMSIWAAVSVVTCLNSEFDTISDAEVVLTISSAAYDFGVKFISYLIVLLVLRFYVLRDDETDSTTLTIHSNNNAISLLNSSSDEKGTLMNTFFTGFSLPGPRASQQDAYKTFASDTLAVGVVCDGAGGHFGGEHASQTAAQFIAKSAEQWPQTGSCDDLITQMTNAVDMAHRSIKRDAASKPGYQDMATTLALVCVRENTAHILWCGDSRVYLFRDGQLFCLIHDHSVVGQMVIDGMLDKQQARCHPESNVITRALGCGCSDPDGGSISLQPGDGLLLVSDGVMDSLDDNQILSLLTKLHESKADDKTIAEAVVQTAVDAGTTDNTTAAWYRHPVSKPEVITKFRQLKMAQVINENCENAVVQPPQNSSQYQLEIIDALGRSRERLLSKSIQVGRLPQSDICLDHDPYLDFSQIKLEPTAEGIKVSSLSSRVDSFIKLGNQPAVHKPPFDLLVGSTLLRVRNTNTERQV